MNGAIARLAVLPKFQGQGFGSQLLSHAVGWFGKMKVKSIFVCTQFENRSAQQLYTKFGFTPLDEDRYILLLEL
jgi:ribosomal protein S18 acetylase RimI-like enzyme